MIKLNKSQQLQAVNIFSRAVRESTLHIRKILSTGHNLFSRGGTEITLKKAVNRRRRCMRLCKLALSGFIR